MQKDIDKAERDPSAFGFPEMLQLVWMFLLLPGLMIGLAITQEPVWLIAVVAAVLVWKPGFRLSEQWPQHREVFLILLILFCFGLFALIGYA